MPGGGIGGTGNCARSPGGTLRSSLSVSVPSRCSASAALTHEVLQLRRRIGACAERLREIETGGEAGVDTAANHAQVLLARHKRFARRRDLRVERAQQKIRLRGQPRQRQRDDILRVVSRQDLRPRALEQSAQPAPEIDLERRRQRDAQIVAHPDRLGRRHRPARARARGGRAEIDFGKQGRVGLAQIGVELLDSCHCGGDVEIVRQRRRDQVVQHAVVVQRPPIAPYRRRRSSASASAAARRGRSSAAASAAAGSPAPPCSRKAPERTRIKPRSAHHAILSSAPAGAARGLCPCAA